MCNYSSCANLCLTDDTANVETAGPDGGQRLHSDDFQHVIVVFFIVFLVVVCVISLQHFA